MASKKGLEILIMNCGGKGKADNRRLAVLDATTRSFAKLALFQEDTLVGITKGLSYWDDTYGYTGHQDASILFNKKYVSVGKFDETLLKTTLGELIILNEITPFDPFSRMCLRKIKTTRIPIFESIVVSWHGRYTTAKLDKRIEEFKSILKYIITLSKKTLLPVLIAGDFNVNCKDIEKYVPSELILHTHLSVEQREKEKVIDYFICSTSLNMSKPELVLESKYDVTGSGDHVEKLLDHRPIKSILEITTETPETTTNTKKEETKQDKREYNTEDAITITETKKTTKITTTTKQTTARETAYIAMTTTIEETNIRKTSNINQPEP